MVNTLNNKFLRFPWELSVFFIEKTGKLQLTPLVFVRLKEEIAKKRPQMKKKKVLFHKDNVLYHKSMATMSKLHELHFKLLFHPPYFSDLASSN